ncbi:MAG: hypothetical protein BroJett015_11710 [Chloroflexota bacterium]|nr:Rpn family recombination-promoting nuclease/putative transposase [Ardenticatenaceae bacterium]GIK55508.1 MAG: hypothetical protein BroJett015_11710 [Chloroflexota bacterium]
MSQPKPTKTKTSDIGAKRLVSLAPTAWVRWLTGVDTAVSLDILSGEFQWVSRANDVLIRANSPAHGDFLVANEIQLHADRRMETRIRAYAALAEERYNLPVFPVLVNILPTTAPISQRYYAEFMGLVARQDFKVINLWEVEAGLVFDLNLPTLLPFVPVLKGGDNVTSVKKAVNLLRAEGDLEELEPLLAFFARFALESEVIRQIMRWDMAVLRESPWYNEILAEGLAEGEKKGQEEMLLHILRRRFGELPYDLMQQIRQLNAEKNLELADLVLEAQSLAEIQAFFHAN